MNLAGPPPRRRYPESYAQQRDRAAANQMARVWLHEARMASDRPSEALDEAEAVAAVERLLSQARGGR